MERIERVARSVEARIQKMSEQGKVDKDIEPTGLLSRMKKSNDETPKEKDAVDRVAEYVMQIRKAKEEILNAASKD